MDPDVFQIQVDLVWKEGGRTEDGQELRLHEETVVLGGVPAQYMPLLEGLARSRRSEGTRKSDWQQAQRSLRLALIGVCLLGWPGLLAKSGGGDARS